MTRIKWLSKANIARLEKGLDIIPLEDTECQWLTNWLEKIIKFECFSHVSNETWTPSVKQKNKNKLMGVRRGVPDYIIVIPGWFRGCKENKLIFIEMKRQPGGGSSISDKQKIWIAALNKCEGVDCHVAKWYQEAKDILLTYASDVIKAKIPNT